METTARVKKVVGQPGGPMDVTVVTPSGECRLEFGPAETEDGGDIGVGDEVAITLTKAPVAAKAKAPAK